VGNSRAIEGPLRLRRSSKKRHRAPGGVLLPGHEESYSKSSFVEMQGKGKRVAKESVGPGRRATTEVRLSGGGSQKICGRKKVGRSGKGEAEKGAVSRLHKKRKRKVRIPWAPDYGMQCPALSAPAESFFSQGEGRSEDYIQKKGEPLRYRGRKRAWKLALGASRRRVRRKLEQTTTNRRRKDSSTSAKKRKSRQL